MAPAGGRVVHPDGTVSYDFDGHISARGVDILAGDDANPASDRKVRWHKDTITGAVVAELQAYQVTGRSAGNYNGLQADAYSADGKGFAILSLIADDNGGTDASRIVAVTQQIPSPPGVATIIDANGNSDFTRTVTGSGDPMKLLGLCDITAFAGPTGASGFSYTFGLPFAFPTIVTAAWIDGLYPQDPNIQLRVYPNGNDNSVDAWFYNGTGADQNLVASLHVAGY